MPNLPTNWMASAGPGGATVGVFRSRLCLQFGYASAHFGK